MRSSSVPTRPLDEYPLVDAGEQPPAPPADPPADAVARSAGATSLQPTPAETLSFVNPVSDTVSLEFPFERDGQTITSIMVRRLTVAEVSDVVESGDFDRDGMWALYAKQSGLPVGVLRGLIEDDGNRVVEIARRFLPRVFAEMLVRAESAATPS